MAYGGTREFQEYGPETQLVNSIQVIDGSTYRAYKYDGWVGNPTTQPATKSVYNSANDTTTVYVSWNGATKVASWRVGGKTVPKDGFETMINVGGNLGTTEASQVEALDAEGNVLNPTQPSVAVKTGGSGSHSGTPSSASGRLSTPLLVGCLGLLASMI